MCCCCVERKSDLVGRVVFGVRFVCVGLQPHSRLATQIQGERRGPSVADVVGSRTQQGLAMQSIVQCNASSWSVC